MLTEATKGTKARRHSPPEAATSLMEATTGFFAASCRISRHIRSEASASPPPESTRSTTAATCAPARPHGSTQAGVLLGCSAPKVGTLAGWNQGRLQ